MGRERSLELVEEPELTPADKLRAALELAEFGFAMKRAALRRQHPEATEDEVEELLFRWKARLS